MSMRFGFLVFPGVQQLDLTGPYEIFASLPGASVHLIWKSSDRVVSATGLPLQPTTTYGECPPLDVLCIPGGAGVNALLEDGATIELVRTQAGRVRYLTAVCTGSLVLGAAGLLRGRRATTHWYSHDLLAAFGALPVRARVVRDGNLITAGGVTAGIDFGLEVVAELAGREQAEAIQLALEYAPAPPFKAGAPDDAPAAAVETAKARMAATRAAREAIVRRLTGAEVPHAT